MSTILSVKLYSTLPLLLFLPNKWHILKSLFYFIFIYIYIYIGGFWWPLLFITHYKCFSMITSYYRCTHTYYKSFSLHLSLTSCFGNHLMEMLTFLQLIFFLHVHSLLRSLSSYYSGPSTQNVSTLGIIFLSAPVSSRLLARALSLRFESMKDSGFV